MAIHAKLTTRGADRPAGQTGAAKKRPPTEEEKAQRKERVVQAKDALKRSVDLKGAHVPPARSALKAYLQRLNEARQPNDEVFKTLLEAPFTAPPKPRGERR